MNVLGKAFHKLRVWTGLADASESHLTPSHGWLLAAATDVRRKREDLDARHAARLPQKNTRA
jgi:hypothetical protein